MGKGYDSDAIVAHVEAHGAKAVIPPRRNRIERCFSKLKHFRRFATRYEKSRASFTALVALACSWIILQLIVDTAYHLP